MKKVISIFILSLPLLAMAQSVSFENDDVRNRGYYDRPYLRYEAESGMCVSNGAFLPQTYDQTQLQSEASNQSAVQLVNQNDYVQWTNMQAADGLTIRFSLPDNASGTGVQGVVALYVDNVFVQNITLDSYWAWQYFRNNGGNSYPDNLPDDVNKFARMRFDEVHILLANKIPADAVFKLVKIDNNSTPYTIDFVELENVPPPVLFSDIADENKVEFDPNGATSLRWFINGNAGKTIYIPAGKHIVSERIYVSGNTKIIGAGMWYTEIFFDASSDVSATYNMRGIEGIGQNISIEGISLNTINNKRYYNNNASYQVGKGIMVGSGGGANWVIRNVRSEHFECGAWMEWIDNLHIENCRFTNNYADGINLCYGTTNSIVEHCLFRNNGDDDMATWSRDVKLCSNNIFRYCTAENNWRASSLGFFGGKQNQAYNIVIIDPLEAGFRVTCDFAGQPFSDVGYNEMYNISVYKGGCLQGTKGISGDLWGSQQGALHLNSSTNYDLKNFIIHDIDLYNSKNNAIFIGSGSKNFSEVYLCNINIQAQNNGIYFSSARGEIKYCNIDFQSVGASNIANLTPTFSFTENCMQTFDLLLPANNTTLTTAQTVFTWQPCFAAGVTGYQLFIDEQLVASPTIPTASVEVANGTHTWFVKALAGGDEISSTSTFSFVMNAQLAVVSPNADNSLLIFPNPSKDIFNIKSENNISEIKIVDIAGKNILAKNIADREFAINLSAFQTGIYFLLIKNEKAVFVKKLIKN